MKNILLGMAILQLVDYGAMIIGLYLIRLRKVLTFQLKVGMVFPITST